MFLVIFSFFLVLANIYFFFKKKYLYIFVPCMLFLPDYYGIELSGFFPIITVSRIMFCVFILYTLINKKKSLSNIITDFGKHFYLLSAYFLLRIVSNLYYVLLYPQPIKTIIHIVFEELFFLVAIYMLDPKESELIITLKVVLWCSTTLFAFGIFESFTSIRPFDELYTVSRTILNDHYYRLGMLRATTTMGLPNFFGNICLLVLPIALYLYHTSCAKRYLLVIILDYFAMIHSGCRSILFFSVIVLGIYFLFYLSNKEERMIFIKHLCIITAVIVIIITILSLSNQYYRYFYVGTAKSLLNEVGFNFDLNEGAPPGVDGYGRNKLSGKLSRLEQLSGIYYTFTQNPIFGLGSGAQNASAIMYYALGEWKYKSTYDLGIVEIIANEGIVGLLGYMALFASILMALPSIKQKSKSYFKLLAIEITVYLLTTLNTVNMQNVLLLILIASLYKHFSSKDKSDETPALA